MENSNQGSVALRVHAGHRGNRTVGMSAILPTVSQEYSAADTLLSPKSRNSNVTIISDR
jgi:hypothetical protein